MKVKIWALACLATFALFFGVSTPAQQAANLTSRLATESHIPKAVTGDAAVAGTTHQKPKQNAAIGDATQACSYAYTSGSGATYMNYCITVNGNFANFESPAGVEMLDQDGAYEGYGICDISTGTAYYDYGYEDSGNWGLSSLVTHTATEVKLERTTSDGAWTLTQTISKVSGDSPYARIIMVFKNNSEETKLTYLLRFAGFVPDDAAASENFSESFDGSNNSTWGYIPEPPNYSTPSSAYGLMLQSVGTVVPLSVESYQEGIAQSTLNGPDPCDPSGNFHGTLTNAIGSGIYLYLINLPKEKTFTATERYMSF
jgi:hypothetical protein